MLSIHYLFSESYSLNSDKLGWIATPIEKLTPMTEKSFTNTVGLGTDCCSLLLGTHL